jgi:hypothetical protein
VEYLSYYFLCNFFSVFSCFALSKVEADFALFQFIFFSHWIWFWYSISSTVTVTIDWQAQSHAMDAFRKQASKIREQVVKQQQVSIFNSLAHPFFKFAFFFLLTLNIIIFFTIPHLGRWEFPKLKMGFHITIHCSQMHLKNGFFIFIFFIGDVWVEFRISEIKNQDAVFLFSWTVLLLLLYLWCCRAWCFTSYFCECCVI